MRIHHRQLSDLIKTYAESTDDGDAAVRKAVRHWRTEIQCGNPVTVPGMPGGTYAETHEFDLWRTRRFPRLYPPAE